MSSVFLRAHANEALLPSTVATRDRSRGRPSLSLSFFFLRAHANETLLPSTVAPHDRSRGAASHSLSSFFFLDALRFLASSARTLSRSISMIAA